mmetsp:Transcript_1867/g.4216  ORF Transcript_1867/g.4216 Transcript_1867/m.4216 type:complete len:216 (-) Transcript_1867:840-1487(-)
MTMLMRTSLAMIRQAAQARTALYACGAAQNPLAMPAYGVADAGIQNRTRNIGGGVPEFWGRPSKYTEGTEFLGTPENHLELVKKRPLSPDLFSIDHVGPHYKMPVTALSSITNRVTGCVLTGAVTGLGLVGLTGDATVAIDSFKSCYPALVIPAKLGITFPLVYHYLGGLRHLFWDTSKIGNQTDKSFLDKDQVETSSNVLFGASIAVSGVITLL